MWEPISWRTGQLVSYKFTSVTSVTHFEQSDVGFHGRKVLVPMTKKKLRGHKSWRQTFEMRKEIANCLCLFLCDKKNTPGDVTVPQCDVIVPQCDVTSLLHEDLTLIDHQRINLQTSAESNPESNERCKPIIFYKKTETWSSLECSSWRCQSSVFCTSALQDLLFVWRPWDHMLGNLLLLHETITLFISRQLACVSACQYKISYQIPHTP